MLLSVNIKSFRTSMAPKHVFKDGMSLPDVFVCVRSGDLFCPFNGCSWTFFTSFELADHMKNACEFGQYNGTVPCTHCPVEYEYEELKLHWQTRHKVAVADLHALTRGSSIICRNYTCNRMFYPNFFDCKNYLKHSVTCKPLYKCQTCNIEYRTELAMRIHKCDGTIKRKDGKSVSKANTQIERNIADRPKLTDVEENKLIKEWKELLSHGNFTCPVPSCDKEFIVPNFFIKHLKLESGIDKIFKNINHVDCPYCSTPVLLFSFHRHMNDNHRVITSILNQIKDGYDMPCPNQLCKEVFNSTSGKEYLKHSIKCRPLYLCTLCGYRARTTKTFDTHLKKIHNVQNNEKSGKSSTNIQQSPANKSSNNNISQPRDQIQSSAKNSHSNPRAKCTKRFKLKEELADPKDSYNTNKTRKLNSVPQKSDLNKTKKLNNLHPKPVHGYKVSKSKEIVSQKKSLKKRIEQVKSLALSSDQNKNLFAPSTDSVIKTIKRKSLKPPSNHLQKDSLLMNKKQKKEKHSSKKTTYNAGKKAREGEEQHFNFDYESPDDGNSHEDTSFQIENSSYDDTPTVIPSDMLDLVPPLVTPLPVSNKTRKSKPTKQIITNVTSPDNNDLAKECSTSINEKHTLRLRPHNNAQEIKVLIEKWMSKIKKGLWFCVYPNCSQRFTDPEKFQSHILELPHQNLRRQILRKKLPCCLCDEFLSLSSFLRHYKQNHANEIGPLVVLNESFICPAEKCSLEVDSAEDYLEHISQCPVKLKELIEAKDDERKKARAAKWISSIKEGKLLCVNESCFPRYFEFPEEFLKHLEECSVTDITQYVLSMKDFICAWCNESLPLLDFPNHFKQHHYQILEILNNKETSITCPNFNCFSKLANGQQLLEHTVACQTCLYCFDCKQTFESYNEYTIHDCFANDELFKKKTADIWRNQVRSGQLRCPNPSCNEIFFIMKNFLEHMKSRCIKSKFMSYIISEDDFPCSFCRRTSVKFKEIEKHIKDKHTEIFKNLQDLNNDKTVDCLNYKCKKSFTDGVKYFHHAAICRPLYFCTICSKEFLNMIEFNSHYCMRNPAPEKPTNEERASSSRVEETPPFDISTWYENIRRAKFECPSCQQNFSMHDQLITHMRQCNKNEHCKLVIEANKFPCCICRKDVEFSLFVVHFKDLHSEVFKALSSLNNRLSVRCSFCMSKRVFLDQGKYFCHIVENHGDMLARNFLVDHRPKIYRVQRTRLNISKADDVKRWKEKIASGQLVCIQPGCNNQFTFIEKFIAHLKKCCQHDEPALNLIRYNAIPCLVCKRTYSANELSEHFRENHLVVFAQLRLVEQGIFIHCPNSKCKEAFSEGTEYLQHIATECQPLYACKNCDQEFETQERLSLHHCEDQVQPRESDKIWDKLTQAPWYERIKKGNLVCPNASCLKEFVLPRDFISHLRTCSEGKEVHMILKRNELPCCFCKCYVSMGKYVSHLTSCHDLFSKKKRSPKKSVQMRRSSSMIQPQTTTEKRKQQSHSLDDAINNTEQSVSHQRITRSLGLTFLPSVINETPSNSLEGINQITELQIPSVVNETPGNSLEGINQITELQVNSEIGSNTETSVIEASKHSPKKRGRPRKLSRERLNEQSTHSSQNIESQICQDMITASPTATVTTEALNEQANNSSVINKEKESSSSISIDVEQNELPFLNEDNRRPQLHFDRFGKRKSSSHTKDKNTRKSTENNKSHEDEVEVTHSIVESKQIPSDDTSSKLSFNRFSKRNKVLAALPPERKLRKRDVYSKGKRNSNLLHKNAAKESVNNEASESSNVVSSNESLAVTNENESSSSHEKCNNEIGALEGQGNDTEISNNTTTSAINNKSVNDAISVAEKSIGDSEEANLIQEVSQSDKNVIDSSRTKNREKESSMNIEVEDSTSLQLRENFSEKPTENLSNETNANFSDENISTAKDSSSKIIVENSSGDVASSEEHLSSAQPTNVKDNSLNAGCVSNNNLDDEQMSSSNVSPEKQVKVKKVLKRKHHSSDGNDMLGMVQELLRKKKRRKSRKRSLNLQRDSSSWTVTEKPRNIKIEEGLKIYKEIHPTQFFVNSQGQTLIERRTSDQQGFVEVKVVNIKQEVIEEMQRPFAISHQLSSQENVPMNSSNDNSQIACEEEETFIPNHSLCTEKQIESSTGDSDIQESYILSKDTESEPLTFEKETHEDFVKKLTTSVVSEESKINDEEDSGESLPNISNIKRADKEVARSIENEYADFVDEAESVEPQVTEGDDNTCNPNPLLIVDDASVKDKSHCRNIETTGIRETAEMNNETLVKISSLSEIPIELSSSQPITKQKLSNDHAHSLGEPCISNESDCNEKAKSEESKGAIDMTTDVEPQEITEESEVITDVAYSNNDTTNKDSEIEKVKSPVKRRRVHKQRGFQKKFNLRITCGRTSSQTESQDEEKNKSFSNTETSIALKDEPLFGSDHPSDEVSVIPNVQSADLDNDESLTNRNKRRRSRRKSRKESISEGIASPVFNKEAEKFIPTEKTTSINQAVLETTKNDDTKLMTQTLDTETLTLNTNKSINESDLSENYATDETILTKVQSVNLDTKTVKSKKHRRTTRKSRKSILDDSTDKDSNDVIQENVVINISKKQEKNPVPDILENLTPSNKIPVENVSVEKDFVDETIVKQTVDEFEVFSTNETKAGDQSDLVTGSFSSVKTVAVSKEEIKNRNENSILNETEFSCSENVEETSPSNLSILESSNDATQIVVEKNKMNHESSYMNEPQIDQNITLKEDLSNVKKSTVKNSPNKLENESDSSAGINNKVDIENRQSNDSIKPKTTKLRHSRRKKTNPKESKRSSEKISNIDSSKFDHGLSGACETHGKKTIDKSLSKPSISIEEETDIVSVERHIINENCPKQTINQSEIIAIKENMDDYTKSNDKMNIPSTTHQQKIGFDIFSSDKSETIDKNSVSEGTKIENKNSMESLQEDTQADVNPTDPEVANDEEKVKDCKETNDEKNPSVNQQSIVSDIRRKMKEKRKLKRKLSITSDSDNEHSNKPELKTQPPRNRSLPTPDKKIINKSKKKLSEIPVKKTESIQDHEVTALWKATLEATVDSALTETSTVAQSPSIETVVFEGTDILSKSVVETENENNDKDKNRESLGFEFTQPYIDLDALSECVMTNSENLSNLMSDNQSEIESEKSKSEELSNKVGIGRRFKYSGLSSRRFANKNKPKQKDTLLGIKAENSSSAVHKESDLLTLMKIKSQKSPSKQKKGENTEVIDLIEKNDLTLQTIEVPPSLKSPVAPEEESFIDFIVEPPLTIAAPKKIQLPKFDIPQVQSIDSISDCVIDHTARTSVLSTSTTETSTVTNVISPTLIANTTSTLSSTSGDLSVTTTISAVMTDVKSTTTEQLLPVAELTTSIAIATTKSSNMAGAAKSSATKTTTKSPATTTTATTQSSASTITIRSLPTTSTSSPVTSTATATATKSLATLTTTKSLATATAAKSQATITNSKSPATATTAKSLATSTTAKSLATSTNAKTPATSTKTKSLTIATITMSPDTATTTKSLTTATTTKLSATKLTESLIKPSEAIINVPKSSPTKVITEKAMTTNRKSTSSISTREKSETVSLNKELATADDTQDLASDISMNELEFTEALMTPEKCKTSLTPMLSPAKELENKENCVKKILLLVPTEEDGNNVIDDDDDPDDDITQDDTNDVLIDDSLHEEDENEILQNTLQEMLQSVPSKSIFVKLPEEIWKSKMSSYEFCCNFTGCGKTFVYPGHIYHHMLKCIHNDGSLSIGEVMFKCPECRKQVEFKKLAVHFLNNHPTLGDILKEYEENETALCKNFKCEEVLFTVKECIRHFRKCGYLKQCEVCSCVYASSGSFRIHLCSPKDSKKEKKRNDKDKDDGNDDNSGKRFKRKWSKGRSRQFGRSSQSINKEKRNSQSQSKQNKIENSDIKAENENELNDVNVKDNDVLNSKCDSIEKNSSHPPIVDIEEGSMTNIQDDKIKTQASEIKQLNVGQHANTKIMNDIIDKNKHCNNKKRDKERKDLNSFLLLKTENQYEKHESDNSEHSVDAKLTEIVASKNKKSDKLNSIESTESNKVTTLESDKSIKPSSFQSIKTERSSKTSVSGMEEAEVYEHNGIIELDNEGSATFDDSLQGNSTDVLDCQATDNAIKVIKTRSKVDTISKHDDTHTINLNNTMKEKKQKSSKKEDLSTTKDKRVSARVSKRVNDKIELKNDSLSVTEELLRNKRLGRKVTVKGEKRHLEDKNDDNSISKDSISSDLSNTTKIVTNQSNKLVGNEEFKIQTDKSPCKESVSILDSILNIGETIPVLISGEEQQLDNSQSDISHEKRYNVSELPTSDDNELEESVKTILGEDKTADTEKLYKFPKLVLHDDSTKSKKHDVRVWANAISNYNFYCPKKGCYQSHYKINTMLKHMKICFKKKLNQLDVYLKRELKCPTCDKNYSVLKLYQHFSKVHLLLNWYFGEVEKGNWAICQNFMCAKYMETIDEMVEHFHQCKYLWKCKYCAIEYNNEPDVEKHHCRSSTSDGENSDADDNAEQMNNHEPLQSTHEKDSIIKSNHPKVKNKQQKSKTTLVSGSKQEVVKEIKKENKKYPLNKTVTKIVDVDETKVTESSDHSNTSKLKKPPKRKSASRAIEKLEMINTEQEINKNNSRKDKKTKKQKTTDDSDVEFIPTASEESSPSEDDVSDNVLSVESSSDGEETFVNKSLSNNIRSKIGENYDENFFKEWYEIFMSVEDVYLNFIPKHDLICILKEREYMKYLPKSTFSPKFKISYYDSFGKSRSTGEVKLRCFESSDQLKGSSSVTFNVGGSVWGMDWCPALESDDQYLAISTFSTYGEINKVTENLQQPGLIQIWKFQNLNSKKITKTKFSFGICHNYGPIYDISWCPSGCYMVENGVIKRIGLLAAACGDGKVRIFSIPDPSKYEDNENIFVTMEPSLVLLPNKLDSIETVVTGCCLCVSWQHFSKQRKIAAGFGDGVVRIWYPESNSIFLKTEYNGSPALLPTIQISAHTYSVRSLAWCPYNQNILITASKDKTVKVFDIYEPNLPLFVLKKGFCLSVEWPMTRLGFFFSEDDCFNVSPISARFVNLERYFFEKRDDKDVPNPTTRHNAAVWSSSYNPFNDMIASCDDAGEVMVCKNIDRMGSKADVNRLKLEPVYHLERTWNKSDQQETSKITMAVSSNSLSSRAETDSERLNVQKNQKHHAVEEENVYKDYLYNFADSNKFEFTKKRNRKDKDFQRNSSNKNLQSPCLDLIETRSVQKIKWNPNIGHHTWLASATKIGIIRLHNFAAWK